MLTILGRTTSANVQIVMWAINELGIDHERLDFGHGHASTATDEYLNMNPMGRVPVMIDGSIRMFESAAILRYIGAVHGTEEFWPRDPAIRGPLDTWAEWGKNTFAPAVLEIFAYDVRLAPDTRDPEILARATRQLRPLAEILNKRLAEGPWIDGDRFTFADIACGHILYRYFTLPWDRPDLSNVRAYYDRLRSRRPYREHVMVSYENLRGSY